MEPPTLKVTTAIPSSWPGSASALVSSLAFYIWSWERNKPEQVYGDLGGGEEEAVESGRKVEIALQEKNKMGRGVGEGEVRVGEAETQIVTEEVLYCQHPALGKK